jgi:phage baseplate assembly protein W
MPTTQPSIYGNKFKNTAHYKAAINSSGQLAVISELQSEYAVGMHLPFKPTAGDPLGFNLAWTTNNAVQADIINLILTQKGERLGNPNFGTDLHRLLFEPNIEELEGKIKNEIEKAIALYQTPGGIGIDLQSVLVERKDPAGNISETIHVTIKYSLLGDIATLTLNLFGGEGPKFASYDTDKAQFVGTTQNEIQWLDNGGTLGW